MKRTVRVLRLLAVCLLSLSEVVSAQNNYLNAVGDPSFGVNVPIENGFINITNGNLHMEFPLATHKQRGALQLNERLVYDSRLWQLVSNGGISWQPTNIPNTPYSQGGWRFVTGAETGTIQANLVYFTQYECPGEPDSGLNVSSYTYTYSWTDPSGTIHPFDVSFVFNQMSCDNTPPPNPVTLVGSAADASGYQITLSGDDQNGPSTITVVDNNGTQVYPQVIDRFGNYWSFDSNGNLIDDLGRTPVIVTTNGNVTYYDVLAPNGPINNNGTRVRYTVTTAPINVVTFFNESDVADWTGTLNPVQSIQLPNGTSYTFTYDHTLGGNLPSYGELTSVTLPTGGQISYGWSNYLDSYQNVNRWLTSRTVGSNPPTTFTPQVLSSCSTNGTGCQEQVTMHKPSGDETVYQLTLNNGAWNTNTTVYNGVANLSNAIVTAINAPDFSHPCTAGVCTGAEYITNLSTLTTVYGSGGTALTQYGYNNPALGKPTSIQEWDYYTTTTPPSTPTRETDYSYSSTGFDLTQETQLGGGNKVAQTTYTYTTSATPTQSIAQHGTLNAGGPYLQSISRWLNNPAGSITTTYSMDDTGMVTAVTDPKQNPPTTVSYQCANTLPYQVTNALGQTTTYGYDCNSRAITSIKDPNDSAAGRSGTVYQYEPIAGQTQLITYPDGGETSYSYLPTNNEVDTSVSATPDPNIQSKDIADSFGRPYQHVEAGVSSETTYDANGRVSCITNPHLIGASSSTDGSTCITSYDGLDRPLVQSQSDGTSSLRWSYNGNVTTSTNEVGNSWQRTTNAFGQLVGIVEPGNLVTIYSYDGLGNLSSMTQSGVSGGETSHTRGFSYDSLSRMVQAHNPESGWTCYGTTGGSVPSGSNCTPGYDPNGNLGAKTDALGAVTTYTYDKLNRLTAKSYSGGSTPTASACYQYDSSSGTGDFIGRLVNEWTIAGNCTTTLPSSGYITRRSILAYDAMGRIQAEQQCHQSHCTTGAPYNTATRYNLAGNPVSFWSDVHSIGFGQSYDSAGRLLSIGSTLSDPTHPGSLFSVGSYVPIGAIQSMTLGTNINVTRGYDTRLRPTNKVATHP